MSEDLMQYQKLVENAMRHVVRDALRIVENDGLPGDHHLYITFRTRDRGVDIADRLLALYPEEMTIVLQFQFWGLKVSDDAFEVTLSFSGQNERLFIPFDAVVGFADPAVNFGLQFRPPEDGDAAAGADGRPAADGTPAPGDDAAGAGEPSDEAGADDGDDAKTGEVVALDAFRKKKT